MIEYITLTNIALAGIFGCIIFNLLNKNISMGVISALMFIALLMI